MNDETSFQRPHHDARPARRRRGALLAGTVAVAIAGAALGTGLVGPQIVPAFAQNQTEALRESGDSVEAPVSFAPIVRQVSPAVVSVRVRQGASESRGDGSAMQMMPDLPEDHPLNRWLRRFGEDMPDMFGDRFGQSPGAPQGPGRRPEGFGMAQGSGFFISADGYLVTNNHVVERGEEIEVTLDDGSSHAAELVGVDEKTDLAVLKVDADREFAYVEFSGSDPAIGDWTVAVGNPFGLGGTVTAGIISGSNRYLGSGPYDDFIQIDAPINRGNSGGPAFNLEGEVIGVNTAIFSPSGGSVGIGFAIPAELASQVVEDLIENGEVTRGWLGVSIQTVSDDIAAALGMDEPRGALVNQPQEGGPAAEAGIRSGDVIVEVDGESVEDARDLSRRIASLSPDQEVEIAVLRDGEEETVTVALARMENEQAASTPGLGGGAPAGLEEYGLMLAPSASVQGAGEDGVVVTGVAPAGLAAGKGIAEGDVILDVGGQPVSSPDEVAQALAAAEEAGRSAVLMRVRSGENTAFLAMDLARAERG